MSHVNDAEGVRKGDRLISVKEAGHITGLSRSTIYERLRDPESKFPRPVKDGKLTRFSLRECGEYVAALLDQRGVA
jgi:excisionase family DNA binding protein